MDGEQENLLFYYSSKGFFRRRRNVSNLDLIKDHQARQLKLWKYSGKWPQTITFFLQTSFSAEEEHKKLFSLFQFINPQAENLVRVLRCCLCTNTNVTTTSALSPVRDMFGIGTKQRRSFVELLVVASTCGCFDFAVCFTREIFALTHFVIRISLYIKQAEKNERQQQSLCFSLHNIHFNATFSARVLGRTESDGIKF